MKWKRFLKYAFVRDGVGWNKKLLKKTPLDGVYFRKTAEFGDVFEEVFEMGFWHYILIEHHICISARSFGVIC